MNYTTLRITLATSAQSSTAHQFSFRKTHHAIPYGAVIADLGINPTKQQYKLGGKELITTNGLNEYDLGARNY